MCHEHGVGVVVVERRIHFREIADSILGQVIPWKEWLSLLGAQGLLGLHYDWLAGVRINLPVALVTLPENKVI